MPGNEAALAVCLPDVRYLPGPKPAANFDVELLLVILTCIDHSNS